MLNVTTTEDLVREAILWANQEEKENQGRRIGKGGQLLSLEPGEATMAQEAIARNLFQGTKWKAEYRNGRPGQYLLILSRRKRRRAHRRRTRKLTKMVNEGNGKPRYFNGRHGHLMR